MSLFPNSLKKVMRCQCGQMTVEFVIAFPTLLIIAVISMNAMLFFSECAAFDRLARQAICVHAAAPGYGQGSAQVAAQVQSQLQQQFSKDWLQVQVASSGHSPGYVTYTAELDFTPTLVGRSFSGSVFGVTVSPLRHQVSMTVDPYKPGAIL